MIGLAARPGTAVLPKCSMRPINTAGSTARSRSASSANSPRPARIVGHDLDRLVEGAFDVAGLGVHAPDYNPFEISPPGRAHHGPAPAHRPFHRRSYLRWEAGQPDKHEYYHGETFAMGGASRRHVTISVNVSAPSTRPSKAAPAAPTWPT